MPRTISSSGAGRACGADSGYMIWCNKVKLIRRKKEKQRVGVAKRVCCLRSRYCVEGSGMVLNAESMIVHF